MLSGLGAGTHIFYENISALAGGVKNAATGLRRPAAPSRDFYHGLCPYPQAPAA